MYTEFRYYRICDPNLKPFVNKDTIFSCRLREISLGSTQDRQLSAVNIAKIGDLPVLEGIFRNPLSTVNCQLNLSSRSQWHFTPN
jgi:hypothetical protein